MEPTMMAPKSPENNEIDAKLTTLGAPIAQGVAPRCMKFGTWLSLPVAAKSTIENYPRGSNFFKGRGQKFHFGEIFYPNFLGRGQREVGSLEHIKQKRLVQFPQQIPTISAKVHQFSWPIFEFQALKNCWGQTHPQ